MFAFIAILLTLVNITWAQEPRPVDTNAEHQLWCEAISRYTDLQVERKNLWRQWEDNAIASGRFSRALPLESSKKTERAKRFLSRMNPKEARPNFMYVSYAWEVCAPESLKKCKRRLGEETMHHAWRSYQFHEQSDSILEQMDHVLAQINSAIESIYSAQARMEAQGIAFTAFDSSNPQTCP